MQEGTLEIFQQTLIKKLFFLSFYLMKLLYQYVCISISKTNTKDTMQKKRTNKKTHLVVILTRNEYNLSSNTFQLKDTRYQCREGTQQIPQSHVQNDNINSTLNLKFSDDTSYLGLHTSILPKTQALLSVFSAIRQIYFFNFSTNHC